VYNSLNLFLFSFSNIKSYMCLFNQILWIIEQSVSVIFWWINKLNFIYLILFNFFLLCNFRIFNRFFNNEQINVYFPFFSYLNMVFVFFFICIKLTLSSSRSLYNFFTENFFKPSFFHRLFSYYFSFVFCLFLYSLVGFNLDNFIFQIRLKHLFSTFWLDSLGY
jgi:hypothetical protein